MTLTALLRAELSTLMVSREHGRYEMFGFARAAGSAYRGTSWRLGVHPAVAGRLEDHARRLFSLTWQHDTGGWVLPERAAHQLGLVTRAGHPVTGVAPVVLAGCLGNTHRAAALWRGVLMACGSVTPSGRDRGVHVPVSHAHFAQALTAVSRGQVRPATVAGGVRVRHGDEVVSLLEWVGAVRTAAAYRSTSATASQEAPASVSRNLSSSNARRSADAGHRVAWQCQQLLERWSDAPEHLAQAARLRVSHPDKSLTELAALAEPGMTKDMFAGRLRRFLSHGARATS